LDNSVVPNIFLYHLSLDIRNNYGESLNDLVEWVDNYLKKDVPELNSFKLKLYEIGYFEEHKSIYQDTGYSIRQESTYKVDGDFPRIIETEIRHGVGDVKYSIVVADCLSFASTESELFQIIIG
jgi:hypothetical protein